VVTGYSAPLRDRVAVRICNAVLRVLATEHYRKMVAGSVEYGLRAAARDERSGALPPLPWSAYTAAGALLPEQTWPGVG
jgi:hypothetical protein